jgi:anti-anti-sigma regulatory factor
MDELLEISLFTLPGVTWLQVHGELDIAGVPSLEAEAAAAPDPEDYCVLDARGLSFCDVVGLRALRRVLEDWAAAGNPASCLLSAAVARVAWLLGDHDLLARAEGVELLAHVASATVSHLEPPLAEWT